MCKTHNNPLQCLEACWSLWRDPLKSFKNTWNDCYMFPRSEFYRETSSPSESSSSFWLHRWLIKCVFNSPGPGSGLSLASLGSSHPPVRVSTLKSSSFKVFSLAGPSSTVWESQLRVTCPSVRRLILLMTSQMVLWNKQRPGTSSGPQSRKHPQVLYSQAESKRVHLQSDVMWRVHCRHVRTFQAAGVLLHRDVVEWFNKVKMFHTFRSSFCSVFSNHSNTSVLQWIVGDVVKAALADLWISLRDVQVPSATPSHGLPDFQRGRLWCRPQFTVTQVWLKKKPQLGVMTVDTSVQRTDIWIQLHRRKDGFTSVKEQLKPSGPWTETRARREVGQS